jgi:prepilin-type N-terminal cleavage/methylation domain-containing protein
MFTKLQNSKAFTLIELLVVMTIIFILLIPVIVIGLIVIGVKTAAPAIQEDGLKGIGEKLWHGTGATEVVEEQVVNLNLPAAPTNVRIKVD